MAEYLLVQGEFLIRLILSAICGGIIGYERKSRGKGAGIRTHLIVAVASALMMIVSKYGFEDLANGAFGTKGADPSRIGAQIVSGVGFLGAGMIYFNKRTPKGLTTAAGIWATSGVGIAMGAGMYVMAGAATAVIVVSQIILHKNLRILYTPNEEQINIVIENSENALSSVENLLSEYDIQIEEIAFERLPDNRLELDIAVAAKREIISTDIVKIAVGNQLIKSISVQGEHNLKVKA